MNKKFNLNPPFEYSLLSFTSSFYPKYERRRPRRYPDPRHTFKGIYWRRLPPPPKNNQKE